MITLTDIRGFELEVIAARLPASGRILKIGSGSGYQAYLLAQRGYEVVALDVSSRPEPQVEYHPVATFDGRNLPFADDHFDAVISSKGAATCRGCSPRAAGC